METKKKSSKWKKLLIVAGIGVTLTCICLVVVVIVSPSPTSTPVAEVETEITDESESDDESEQPLEQSQTATPEILATPTLPPEPTKTNTPQPTPTPIKGLVRIGTHIVGKDIQPGIYRGLAGDDLFDSCYWARVSDLTGDMDSLIANDNGIGQFYVEVRGTDHALETGCELILLEYAPMLEIGNTLPPGTYIVGRDIQPGTYQGQAGDDITESCYWARLQDVSGDMGALIANDNAKGSYYVQVVESDFALKTNCPLEKTEQ